MGIAVSQFLGTLVLAGVSCGLLQQFLQRGNTGEVLGECGNIVDPVGTTVLRIAAGDIGHGQRQEEGIAAGNHHFGNLRLDAYVKTQFQVFCAGFSVGIRQRHSGTAIGFHIRFQSVLGGSCVAFQSGVQSIDEDIGLVIVILGTVQLIGIGSIGILLGTAVQAQGLQEVRTFGLVDAVQNLNVIGGGAVVGGLGKLDDIRDPQIRELHTGDGISEALFAVAQVTGIVGITGTGSTDEGIINILVIDTGGDIAGIPDTVLFRIGQVHLVDGQAAGSVLVNENIFRGIIGFHCGCAHRERQDQSKGQNQGKRLCQFSHRK